MKRDLASINYEKNAIPPGYKCDDCQVSGVKLWREYQTFADNTDLLCANCAEKNQHISSEPGWISPFKQGNGDQIGWFIPAIPVEGDNTYWGYTSVPEAGVKWWNNLPVSINK